MALLCQATEQADRRFGIGSRDSWTPCLQRIRTRTEMRGLNVSVRELQLPKANPVLTFPEFMHPKSATAVAKADPSTPPVPVLIALK